MSGNILSVNPWATDDADFPRSGSMRDRLVFCINYAVLAPSIHNTQPWLFRLLDDSIEVYLDQARSLRATDPSRREMTISCGAALTNLLVAIRRFGNEASVQYFPDPQNLDLLARVRLGRPVVADYEDESLFRSIRRRRTVRRPFQPRPVPRELQRRMIWLASEYGCWLYCVESGPARDQIASLVEAAHEWQLHDPAYQAERASWIGSGDHSSRNGSFDLDNGSHLESDVVGEQWLQRDRELIKASPALCALGTNADTPMEWLRAGEALQRILLYAETLHVSASFLNQPCQIPELREQLRLITGWSGPPQVLLRMGYGTPSDPTFRRPVEDVLLPSQTNSSC